MLYCLEYMFDRLKRGERMRARLPTDSLPAECVLYSCMWVTGGEIPNGKEGHVCPDRHRMRSSGAKTLKSMSCKVAENLSGGSREETSKPSLAGWPSMPRFPSSDEQDGSRSGKKAGEVAEAIGMPIASRIDASARAILGHQPW